MTTCDRGVVHVRQSVFPCCGDIHQLRHRAILTVKHKRRARDATRQIRFVVIPIHLNCGAVIVAHCAYAIGVPPVVAIYYQRFRIEIRQAGFAKPQKTVRATLKCDSY